MENKFESRARGQASFKATGNSGLGVSIQDDLTDLSSGKYAACGGNVTVRIPLKQDGWRMSAE